MSLRVIPHIMKTTELATDFSSTYNHKNFQNYRMFCETWLELIIVSSFLYTVKRPCEDNIYRGYAIRYASQHSRTL